jgi:hypothetical protein
MTQRSETIQSTTIQSTTGAQSLSLSWPPRKTDPISATQKESILTRIKTSIKRKFTKPPSWRLFSLDTRPHLPLPKPPAPGSFSPPRFFFKGALETDRKKNPEPIWQLLTESLEEPLSRPVPHNVPLMKSLCKGHGQLKKNKQGFIYLDVGNQFINSMLPYLRPEGLTRPPYFNLFIAPGGAHIPIISKRESDFHYLDEIKELDQTFSFVIEGLYSSKPDTWPEVEEVWFLKVQSTELEALRHRYFLTALPNGHDFHIAIAVKPRSKSILTKRPAPIMRINPGFVAA